MNLQQEGWFQQYLDFRAANPLRPRLPSTGVKIFEEAGVHNESDQAIYYFLQPTGIFYGMPIAFPFPGLAYPRSEYYNADDRALVTVLDALMACLVADRHFLLTGLADETDHFLPAVETVQEFYLHYPPEFGARLPSMIRLFPFGRKGKYPYRRFEAEFHHRVTAKSALLKIRDPFANIFLFLDLFHCLTWQRRRLLDGVELDALGDQYREQMAQRETLLRLIIATLLVDRVVEPTDLRLMERFFHASRLPAERVARLRREMSSGIELEKVEIPAMPWLIRRSFLAQALMITMLDRSISTTEESLLARLVERLGLWKEELEQSRAALEGFLVVQGEQIQYQTRSPNLFLLSDQLAERASIAIRLNLNRILNEIRETHELYNLLMKATVEPLTREEKHKVQEQLLDILKTIPTLAIFALPGGGIILPILIRLLPFKILPSSFEE